MPDLQLLDLPVLDDTQLVYAYDYDFFDDSPLDYMGESINLPSLGGSDSSFASFDEYNPEDFEFGWWKHTDTFVLGTIWGMGK